MSGKNTLGRENIYRGKDKGVMLNHSWGHAYANDYFIETTKSVHPVVETKELEGSTHEGTTVILGIAGRHGYNNETLIKNLSEVFREQYPKKGRNAFETGRISYFSGDDGKPGSQLIMEEKCPKTVEVTMVGRSGTNSDGIERHISKVLLEVSSVPLEHAIAITQSDIAKILYLVDGMQKDMNIEEYKLLRYKLIARSIIGLCKLYADDVFLEKQRKRLYDIHNPKALSVDCTKEDMCNISISHYADSICEEYNTYLAIIPSQYILLPDAIKKDFDFFVQAAHDIHDKTQKVHDIRMVNKKGYKQTEMIKLLENIDTNLVQRNSRFHNILQDMCKHPEVQKRLGIFDY